jgi:hypothetical protein
MNRATVTAREAVRHVLFSTGAYGALKWLRARRGGGNWAHLQQGDARARFQAIYETGVWRHGVDETPGSGSGSSLQATATLREALPALLRELGAATLLDVGCGDFTWMQSVGISQKYIGVDIVESVIAQNKSRFSSEVREFFFRDAMTDELPAADVVMCREVLFHLSFDDIRKVLRNLLSKERKYLVLTSDRQTLFNSDIPTGDFRLLNLEAWPLKFPAPVRVIDDSRVSPNRIVGVWEAEGLRRRVQ